MFFFETKDLQGILILSNIVFNRVTILFKVSSPRKPKTSLFPTNKLGNKVQKISAKHKAFISVR